MAINKVIVNGETKLDLTADTTTVNKVLKGFTFHDATGTLRTGTLESAMPAGGFYQEVIELTGDDRYEVLTNYVIEVNVQNDSSNHFYCFHHGSFESLYNDKIRTSVGNGSTEKYVILAENQFSYNVSIDESAGGGY